MPSDIRETIEKLLLEHSPGAIEAELRRAASGPVERVLTVIANAGLHAIPREYERGSVVNFSEGTLGLQAEFADDTLRKLVKTFAEKLKAERWTKIFLVPTGHPLLSIVSSLVIFRITRIEPIVLAYFGDEGYRDIALDTRAWITASKI